MRNNPTGPSLCQLHSPYVSVQMVAREVVRSGRKNESALGYDKALRSNESYAAANTRSTVAVML
jgi:hypothetical protein